MRTSCWSSLQKGTCSRAQTVVVSRPNGGELLDLVCQRIAPLVEEAVKAPQFGHIGIHVLQRIVGYISEGKWSEKIVHLLPCGDKEDHAMSQVKNVHGAQMELAREEGDAVGVYIQKAATMHHHALNLLCGNFIAIDG